MQKGSFFIKLVEVFAEDEERLLPELQVASDEIEQFFNNPTVTVEPLRLQEYKEKYKLLYEKCCREICSLHYRLRVRRKEFHAYAPPFVKGYSRLEQRRTEHNNAVANRLLVSVDKLVNPVEGTILGKQQLLCIGKEVHNHLVLAGAGCGKTTTILGLVKYLLASGKATESEILVLSFTNASAHEMSDRLRAETGRDIYASTFHKLGMNIITDCDGKKPSICNIDPRRFAADMLKELMKSEQYLFKLCIYLSFAGKESCSEFNFETYDEYNKFLKCNPPTTLKNERVKSYGEVEIANYLFQNGVNYVYEASYPVKTSSKEYGQYHPDFYLPDYDIYIEYFGINRDGCVPAYFTSMHGKSASEEYRASMEWKRGIHRLNGTELIEVYAYEKLNGELISSLEDKLKNAGVRITPISPLYLMNKVMPNRNKAIESMAELFSSIISLMKGKDVSISVLKDLCERNSRRYLNLLLVELIEPIYEAYQQKLNSMGEIDFNDMINHATKLVKEQRYNHTYKYVIVDEYQDISWTRYSLLKAMREVCDFSLFCVGDDWQSIYRFNGSDIGYILNFEQFWGAAEESRIETTYRFPRSILEVSGKFVMKNPAQKKKELNTKNPDRKFALEMITANNEYEAGKKIEEILYTLPKYASVLLLGRYRNDVDLLKERDRFNLRYDTVQKCAVLQYKVREDLRITYRTVHGAKGLQADYVFILNNKQSGMGFPSRVSDEPLANLLLEKSDVFPFAEERRLFYVALTRAKRRVYLLCINGNESEFIRELLRDFPSSFHTGNFYCPRCGGRLIEKNGSRGKFLGCSNFHRTGCNYTRST